MGFLGYLEGLRVYSIDLDTVSTWITGLVPLYPLGCWFAARQFASQSNLSSFLILGYHHLDSLLRPSSLLQLSVLGLRSYLYYDFYALIQGCPMYLIFVVSIYNTIQHNIARMDTLFERLDDLHPQREFVVEEKKAILLESLPGSWRAFKEVSPHETTKLSLTWISVYKRKRIRQTQVQPLLPQQGFKIETKNLKAISPASTAIKEDLSLRNAITIQFSQLRSPYSYEDVKLTPQYLQTPKRVSRTYIHGPLESGINRIRQVQVGRPSIRKQD